MVEPQHHPACLVFEFGLVDFVLAGLVFGVVHQVTHSYRPAIAALVIFFAVGGIILLRVNAAEGIRQAQQAPAQH